MKRLLMALYLLMFIIILVSCTGFTEVDHGEVLQLEETKVEEPDEINSITISMVGDMLFYGTVDSYMKKYGDGYVLEGYGPLMRESDIVLGNLETSISYRGEPMKDKQYTFRGRPEVLKVLKESNFHAVSIANNHVLDFGIEAFLDTLDNLEKYEILYAGGGRNREEAEKGTIIEKNGIKVGFLAFTKVVPVVDWYAGKNKPGIIGAYKVHEQEVVRTIQEMRENCHVLVVSVHWGQEGTTTIRDEERYIGHSMIDAGADIVMGHHPHVVQGIEIYKDKPIFYSLGNFIFTTSKMDISNKTIMANVRVDQEGNVLDIHVVPGTIVNGKPTPMEGIERDNFIKYLNGLNVNYVLH
ncbi:CapA family protein [Lutispora thermophila]|uniref:Poly-gamma-glutamate biosynthesis protein CapA/YwtB (Capsule formation), metallophosphatase superfamily n=1 Tax=Lutispora thermophila DSM 19022 TaxID=1122184 RepID=A0A1M6B2U3_9FIRM|nr:CapA family protein [Lutispora thermophila]SHI43000.1 Poly-gamma-glutamate biosynthesis protein CapA/YwtB (capsule formation), metallophosphatase superfamily [Lutispora thermophila DSM 19022]